MKNEEKVLLRMLNSVLPIVDECICVDTGSTDNSKEIVKKFFDDKNIPCVIYDYEFTNFADTRNTALGRLISHCDVSSDFGFWMDCDEELFLDEAFDIQKFKHFLSSIDCAMVAAGYAESSNARRSFFKIDKSFYWKGAVHELLICNEPVKVEMYPLMRVLARAEGNSWNEPNKYAKHAEILLKEVEKTNDPRDVFYLAQSYKDAGDTENAIKWYVNRALRDDGFAEEKYYARHMVSVLTKKYEDYFAAHEIDPARGEHILNLILEFQKGGYYQTAYIFSKYAVEKYHNKNPYPSRLLFVDEGTYSEKILNAHIESCIHTGNTEEIKQYMDLEKTYQYLCDSPSDINYHLPKLKEYASKYKHCTEMGVRWCVSTYALLMGRPEKLISYDIHYNPAIEKVKAIAEKEKINFQFIQADVLKVQIEPTDFLFIDTWHCDHQLVKELMHHSSKVKHAIAFHDTTTFWEKGEDGGRGLKYAIEPFLEDNSEWKITYRTAENNGLLIIERFDKLSDPT